MLECVVCSSPAPHKCARCKCVFYCSPIHQKEDWKVHRIHCPRLAQEALAAVFHPCDEELLLRITTCLAQNEYFSEVKIMVQLNKAFWWDEQIWDAFKDERGGGVFGRTRLMFAAMWGDLERVRFLLNRGAKVNIGCANDGKTALMFSSETGNLKVVRELLERGANVNAARTDGWTALMWACQDKYLEVVRELCARGANVNAQTDDGWTSLMWASQEGYLEIFRELCESGAHVNSTRITDGCTPLIMASQEGHLDIVRELCGRGATVDAVTTDTGGTAVLWASWKGHTEIVRELCSRHCSLSIYTTGVDSEANTTPGMTPLMIAAREGHKDTVAVLLACGADPAATDHKGITAHAFALANGHAGVCALLEKA